MKLAAVCMSIFAWCALAKAGADFPPEGHYATGRVNTNILDYIKAHGAEVGHAAATEGSSIYVHYLSGNGHVASAQDFAGGTHKTVTIFDAEYHGRQFASELNDLHGLRSYYQTHGSIAAFGPPIDNEHAVPGGTRQDFVAGVLKWDSATGAVKSN